jgi:hypothetical protein
VQGSHGGHETYARTAGARAVERVPKCFARSQNLGTARRLGHPAILSDASEKVVSFPLESNMRPLGILAFGAAVIIFASCGARTPFEVDPEGSLGTAGAHTTGGNVVTTGAGPGTDTGSGPGTETGPGPGPVVTTTGSITIGSSVGSGVGGRSGAGGFGGFSGVGGFTGAGGRSGVGGFGGFSGVGGFGGFGTSGSAVTVTTTGGVGGRAGTGGFGGTGGQGGSTGNPLLGILPGVHQTPGCLRCVDTRCNSVAGCSSDACVKGVACYFSVCASVPDQGQQVACALKCFNGDLGLLTRALQAVTCVYGPCGPQCTGGRGG